MKHKINFATPFLGLVGGLFMICAARPAQAAVTAITSSDFTAPKVLDFNSVPLGNISGTDSVFTNFGISSVTTEAAYYDDEFGVRPNASRSLWQNGAGLAIVEPGNGGLADDITYTFNLSSPKSKFGIGVHDQGAYFEVKFFRGATQVGSGFFDSSPANADLFQVYFASTESFDRVVIYNGGGGYSVDNITIEDEPTIVVNNVTLSPSAPKTNSVVSAQVSASGPAGANLTYSYQWKKNGVAISGETGQSLDLSKAGNGDKGDKISVEVVARNGQTSSVPFTSNAVTVANSSPVATSVTVTPSNPTTTSLLTATATGTDADGDNLSFLYVWRKNGFVISGETAQTLNLAKAGNGDAGDTITVEVKARDNSANSAPLFSTPVTIAADAPTGSAPVISSVTLSPSSPKTRDVVKATVAATATNGDSDSLTFTYIWKNNGTPIAGETGSTLDLAKAGNGDKGQTITVEVVAHEGAASSAVKSASVIVANTASAPTSVVISPSTPGTNDLLTATATGADVDGDAFTFVYQWKRNGSVISGETGQTLNLAKAGNGDSGDTITVEVKTREGNTNSAPLASAPVTISGGVAAAALRFAPSAGNS